MTKEENIAQIWALRCDQDVKLTLLGIAIGMPEKFTVDEPLIAYLARKTGYTYYHTETIINSLTSYGAFAFDKTDPDVWFLNLAPDVIKAIES